MSSKAPRHKQTFKAISVAGDVDGCKGCEKRASRRTKVCRDRFNGFIRADEPVPMKVKANHY